MSSHLRSNLRLTSVLFLLLVAGTFSVSAAEVKILFDVDHNQATGCGVPTTAGTIPGVEMIVTTTWDTASRRVTAVTRQQCAAGVFGAPVMIDTSSWAVGTDAERNSVIETHVPTSIFGATFPMGMQVAFAASSGPNFDTVATNEDGAPTFFPLFMPGRHRAVASPSVRTIVMDGSLGDWSGLYPLPMFGEGGAALRFNAIYAWATEGQFYFAFALGMRSSAPTVFDWDYTVLRGGSLTIANPGILANALDPSGQPLTAERTNGPEHGALTLNPGGGFGYVHDGSHAPVDHFHYRATDGTDQSNQATVTFHIVDGTSPAITTANNTTFTVGTPGTFTVLAVGIPSPTLSDTGTLPAGVSFTPAGSHATISGTPGPGTGGTYTIFISASNGVPPGASQTFTLTVDQAPAITSANNAHFQATVPSNFTVTTSGFPHPSLGESGALPSGITFTDNHDGTATLGGSAANGSGGVYPITITATNVAGSSPQSFTVTVCNGIVVTSPGVTSGTANTAFSQTFTQAGAVGAATFSLASGTLPTGLTLAANGTLSGTPTQTGSFPITVRVTDSQGCTGTGPTYTLVINCQTITVTNPATNTGTANAAFSQMFTASNTIGATTFTLASGTLPTGLTLAANGTLSGTPTQTGSFPITVKATDANGCFGTGATYTLTISCQTITVTNPGVTTGTAKAAFSQTFTASNTIGATTFTTASTLPAGLTLSTGGVLSGTPTVVGTFPIVVKATDANGCFGSGATYNLVISCQVISVTNPGVTSGTAGSAFSQTFSAGNTVGAVTFTTASTLPAGLTLSTAGVLSGTPTVVGTFPIVVTATDANGCSGNGATYNLVINCQTITVTKPVTTTATVGTAFSQTFTQGGAIGGATFTTASTLPTGLSLSAAGVLSGTPTQSGSFPIVVTVTDGNGCTGSSATYTLVVTCQTITVTNPVTNSGVANAAFNQTFTQSGALAGATFTTASTLPTGLSLSTGGVLSGTPTQTGSFPIVVVVTDGHGCTGTGSTYTLTITCQVITVNNPVTTTGTAGSPFSQTFTATNSIGATTFSTTSSLPAGLSLSTGGVLSGTPTVVGSFPIVVKATDANGCIGTGSTYTLVIGCQTITVTKPVTTTGTANSPFSQTFTQAGAIGTATFTTASTLPAGLSLSTSGVLSGTPTQTGSFPIVVTVTDSNGCTGNSTTYNLAISCQTITVTKPVNTSGTVNAPFSEQFTQTGAIGGATFTTASTLPTGLTLSTAGLLAGTPTQPGTFPIVVTVTDGNGCTGTSSTYNLVIACQTITVTNPVTNSVAAGTPFSVTFTQMGGIGTTNFTTVSTLPTGLTLHAATGVLDGTPNQGGTFPIVVTATDSNGCTGNGATYTLTVTCPTITVTNPGVSTGTAGVAFSQTFTQGGGIGTITWSETGALPAGISLNTSTGVLSGTTSQVGTFPITVTATDQNGCQGIGATYNLTFNCQTVTVTNPGVNTGTVDAPFSQTFTKSGILGTVTWSETGALPSGITLDSMTGVLSGTPLVNGSFPITVKATDTNGCFGTSSYTLTINCQTITVTKPVVTTGTVDSPFSQTFTQSGVGTHTPATFTINSGSLPSGLTLSTAGVLSGTPGQPGSFPITVKVTDANGCFGVSSTYTLVIACQTITVTNPATTTGTVGVGFSQTFTQSGVGTHTPATFTTASTLPTGFSLSTAGVLSGSTNQHGTFPIVVTVTDANGCTGTGATYNLVINCQTITVTNPVNTNGTVGSPFSEQFTQTGALGGATFGTASTLPTGLTLSSAGLLAGTPLQSGTFPIVVTVTDGNGCTGNGPTYTLVIACNVITVTNPGTTTGTAGTFFTSTFTQMGGNGTITWSETGALPSGITLNTSSGVLSGTTSATGSFPITVTATDSNGCTGTGSTYTLVINCQTVTITNPAQTSVQAGVALNATFTTTAGSILGTPTWSETGSLPSGITLDSMTGVLSGTTNAVGSFPITVKVTDTNGCFGTSSYTLTVTCPTITVTRVGGGSFPAATFNVGYPAGNQLQASGQSGTIHWAFPAGDQPPGINLTIVAGTLSGIPSATGTFNMIPVATDQSTGCTGQATFPFTILPNLTADTYNNLVNNTEAVVTGGTTTSPATPFVTLSGTLVSNDTPAAGVTATAGTFATTQGGSVTIAADGTFKYTPPVTAAALSSDTFTYTGVSNTGTIPSIPQYAASTGSSSTTKTATLNLVGRVWYVKNNGSNGNGQSQSPFNTLANFTNGARVSPDAASDIIYVYNGDGTTTNQNAGVKLLASEQLIGQGVALVVNSNTLVAAGTKPQITNATAASDTVTLNDGNTVKGVTITGATRDGIAGSSHAGFTGDTLTIQNNTSSGLHLTSMTGTVTVTNATISGNATGLDINNGTAAITLDNTNSITANAGQRSVSIQNRPASAGTITLGTTVTDNGTGILVNANTSGTIDFTGNQTMTTTTNPGVSLTSNTGTTINFSGGTSSITTTTGTGFNATGGGTVGVTNTMNVTTGAAAAGINLNGVTSSGITFNTVNTTGATTGVSLTSLGNGNVTINGGTISGGTTGLSMSTLGTSTTTLSGVTFTGSTSAISGGTFGTLSVGSSVNVSGATGLNLATGAVSGTFANVSSTGGTNGVNLNAVTGTWGATAGSLTGASGATFNVTGGSGGTITWGPSITQSNGANVVTIAGSNSYTINFGGNVTSSGTSTGLSIGGSSGSYSFNGTNAFSGAGGITLGAGGESGSISFSNSTTNTVSGDAFTVDGTTGTVTAAITYSGTIDKATSGSTGFLVKVNKLNSGGGSLTMSHAPAAAGNLKQNFSTASGISVTNSSSGSISISDASVTFVSTAAGFTGSGNTGTINLNDIDLAGSGNKAGMLISGGGTINVADGANSSSINMTGSTGAAIDGTTSSYTGTLNLTNATITGGGGTAVTLTGGGTAVLGGTGSSITNAGIALLLNGVALTNGAGMTSVTSSAGVNGISLTSVTGGTYTIPGGSLTGNTGASFSSTTSSPTLSYAGNITNNTNRLINISNGAAAACGTLTFSGNLNSAGGLGILVNNCNSGTMTFSGSTQSMSTGGTSAVSLTNNSGTTMNFTGGSLALTTSSGNGFNATGGGTVSVTGANNTINSGTGVALNVTSTTIGGSGLTFKSIAANGGSSGIILSSTGAGSLTVTGDGASDPANATRGNTTAKNGGGTITIGSGGTIQNGSSSGIALTSTGAVSLTSMKIITPSGQSVNSGANGITASTVGGLTLDNVFINGFTGNSGLMGTSVTNLSMQHTDIDGNGTTVGTETNNNWNVRLDELAGNCGSTCNWQNSLFFNSRENIVGITQGVTNTSVNVNMTITNCEFRDTTTFANPANDAFLVSTHANAVTNITATGSTFKNVEVCGFQYTGNDNDSGTVNVRNSIFENTGSDIILAHGGGSGGNSTVTFDTSGNTTRQLTGNPLSTVAFDYFLAGLSGASSVLSGTVKNNSIGNSGVTGSGSHVGDGMDANATGSGTLTVTLGTGPSGPSGSNTIHQVKNGDAFFGEANSGSAKLNIFMHNDSFNTDNATATAGAHLVGSAMSSDSSTLCVDMSANTLNGPGYSGVELDNFGTTAMIKLVGMPAADNNVPASIASFINGANTAVSPAASAGFVVISGGQIISGTCGVAFP